MVVIKVDLLNRGIIGRSWSFIKTILITEMTNILLN